MLFAFSIRFSCVTRKGSLSTVSLCAVVTSGSATYRSMPFWIFPVANIRRTRARRHTSQKDRSDWYILHLCAVGISTPLALPGCAMTLR